MPTKHIVYDPAIPLICQYEPEAGESIKHALKVTDAADGVEEQAIYTETRIPIIDSEAKGENVLHFIYKFSQARELMSWNYWATLISKFELHLQGSYQIDWQEILDATDPNDERNGEYFEEQVQNMLSNIFAKEKRSEMVSYIQTWCKKWGWCATSRSMLIFCHLITTTQRQLPNAPQELFSIKEQLPNAPQELFSIKEQKRILLHMFSLNTVMNLVNAGMTTSKETL
jgi:hypothetical protein